MPAMMYLMLLVATFGLGTVAGAQDLPEVTLNSGTIRGIVRKTTFGKEFNAYLGIPYAKPPVGHNRFKVAEANDPWEGVWNATATPNECLHINYFTFEIHGSEDCLYVNVYTPKQPKSKPMDVLVNIHGGGFHFFSGAMYGPEFILERDIVYVTFNYRLGVLGFLSFEDELLPGNNGLKDQNLALKWVNQNIAAFNGDPKKITISGMSAGGASVHSHILSKQSKGLFQKAIMNSGALFNPWALAENVREKSLRLVAELGCPTGESTSKILECLRQRPAERIVESIGILRVYRYFQLSPIGPMIEKSGPSSFIDKHPFDIIRAGETNDVPILWSYNSDEGLFPGADHLADETGFLDKNWESLMPHILDLNTEDPERQVQIVRKIKEQYLGGKPMRENPGNYTQLLGDRFIYVGQNEATKVHAQYSKSPVWVYKFSHVGAKRLSDVYNIDYLYKGGACHGDDTHFVLRAAYCPLEGNHKDEAMIKTMTNIWMNFIQGNMPSSWKTVKSGLPDITVLDIVDSDPKNNVVKTEPITAGQKLWLSFCLPEICKDNIQAGHNHSDL